MHKQLPELLPKAIAWAESLSQHIAKEGSPIDECLQSLARKVGVSHPERIRILEVAHLPRPEDPDLCHACFASGMLGANMTGMSLGYNILLQAGGHSDQKVLAHEFRHVYQFEEAGSLPAFLTIYADQVLAHGYTNAPLEWDARQQENLINP